MKKSKIIIPALAMLVMSTAATVTGTVAWFSMNKTVTAEGMLVRAQGQGSIVITKHDGADANKGRPQTTDKTTGIDFNDLGVDANGEANNKLFPSTHIQSGDKFSGTKEGNETVSASGLKYVNNGGVICYETGTVKNSTDAISWSAVTTSANYYVDYDLYIGGDGQGFTNQSVKISFGTLSPELANIENINKAISIDFYAETAAEYASVDTAHFVGTLNLAGYDPATNNAVARTNGGATPDNSITLTGATIPQSGSATSLCIKMRVYYDGNLIDHVGQVAYTDYTDCQSGEDVGDYPDAHYFYNANGDIMFDNSDTSKSVEGYKVVNRTRSTTTFAKSVDYTLLQNIALGVVFSAN